MTKQELMETHTAEKLAEMVVTAMQSKEDGEKLIEIITSAGKDLEKQLDEKQTENDRLRSEVEKYRKAFEDEKKERDCQICEYQNKIDELKGKLKIQTASTKYVEEYVDRLKNDLNRSRTTINQIDEILSELFGVKFKLLRTKEQLEGFKNCAKIRLENSNKISSKLPTEPIKVADVLIHNYKQGLYPVYQKDEHGNIDHIDSDGKKVPIWTGEYAEYSELRQIAEHLLVYCNHNGEAEE